MAAEAASKPIAKVRCPLMEMLEKMRDPKDRRRVTYSSGGLSILA
jgi:hypothetical protein